MMTMGGDGDGGGGVGGEEEELLLQRLGRTPKEGERILAPTRRPDGTLRKPIRIRAGYVPQDEVAIYQSKGALLRKAAAQPQVPPGYDLVLDAKPKTKSAKRNERKKEKKHQMASASSTDKGKSTDSKEAREVDTEEVHSADLKVHSSDAVESVTGQMNNLYVSATPLAVGPSSDSLQDSNPEAPAPDLDKKIRALKKKIRLAEMQQKGDQQDMKPEQSQKLAKAEGWREELKLLEDKKAPLVS